MEKVEWWEPTFGGSMLILAGGLIIGVVHPKTGGKYFASYQIGGKEIYLDSYKEIEDAKIACEHAIREFIRCVAFQLGEKL